MDPMRKVALPGSANKRTSPQRLFRPVKERESVYRSCFETAAKTECDRLQREVRHQGYKTEGERAHGYRASNSVRDRLLGYRFCGLSTKHQECCGCGKADLGSASYMSCGNARPCQLRNCGFCGRRSGAEKAQNLSSAWRGMSKRDGYELRMITVQIAWQPWLEESFTVDSYRDRALQGWNAIRAAWNPTRYLKLPKNHPLIEHGLKQEGAGLYAKIEASQNGFLHFHLLHYGPYLKWYCDREICKDHCRCQRKGRKPKKHFYLKDILQAAYPAIGEIWIEEVKGDKQEKAIAEVCKYVSKAPSPLDEKAILGTPRWRLNPVVAVRLELALFGMHCTESYGSFRKAPQPRVTEEELGELSSGVDGLIEDLFAKNFPTHEDFLNCVESVPYMEDMLADMTEEEERAATVALAELIEAHGPCSRDSLVALLAELLHEKRQAEQWLDPNRACKHCGARGKFVDKVMPTADWIRYKRSLLERN